MATSLVFSVIGPDRSGLVRSLSSLVSEYDGNWLEGRMLRLGGQFTGVVRCSVAEENEAALVEALRGFDDEFEVIVKADGDFAEGEGLLVELSIQGQDRVGIVREVSTLLGNLSVNVEELHSESLSAPMSAESLFHLDAIVRLPDELSLDSLQSELEALSTDLVIDLEPVE